MNLQSPLLAAALCVAASFAYAQTPTTFYGCVDKNGALTMGTASTVCKTGSTKIQWNNPGPQGPKGDTGSPGSKGDTGTQGPEGPAGTTGQGLVHYSSGLAVTYLGPSDTRYGFRSATVSGDSNTFYLISYGGTFANEGPTQCTVGMWVQKESNPALQDSAISLPPATSQFSGYGTLSGMAAIVGDGTTHTINLVVWSGECGTTYV